MISEILEGLFKKGKAHKINKPAHYQAKTWLCRRYMWIAERKYRLRKKRRRRKDPLPTRMWLYPRFMFIMNDALMKHIWL